MIEFFDYAAPEPPVIEDRLLELTRWLSENKFPDTELPEDYTEFLRESNGGDFVKNDREFQMFKAEEIPGFYEAYMFGEFMPFALPIGADGCGNLYIFDKRGSCSAVYLVDAGNMGWDGDGFELLAESFLDCINGNFKQS
ncbi:MAG: SMI1/KNR4 family protein [Oscillospiraceae bacterium]|nr:SMI1/KNR4 family protein [Oscillospiraceae bacterium]